MKTPISSIARVALPLLLLASAVVRTPAHTEAATAGAASALVRYTSAAYGYSLAVLAGWVRVPGVQWTPGGPTADLTVMTPDHQAALGVIVTPTGNHAYSDAELQAVALRLLLHENAVVSGKYVQQKRIVINGVPFETAEATTISGGGYEFESGTVVSVGVTQRYNRLYAIAEAVYMWQTALPPGGNGEPTATPEGGYGVAPDARRWGQEAAPAPAPVPTAGAAMAAGRRVESPPAGPPQPLPTDHLRGNPCPNASQDGSLIIRDKNCAFTAEAQALTAMGKSFSFTLQNTADRRPEATVGPDGFAVAADPASGYRLEYPVEWKPMSVPNTNGAVRSADHNALVTLAIQRTSAETLGASDLQSLAQSQIPRVIAGTPTSYPPPTYQTAQVGGVTYLRALVLLGAMPTADAPLTWSTAQVSLTVASYHHRVYILRAIALIYLSIEQNTAPPAVYPFFTPFTTLARLTQSEADLLMQQSELAQQTTLSLAIDPHVREG